MNYIDTRLTDYDIQKYDAYIPVEIKQEKDDFYYDDGVNLSNNKFIDSLNETNDIIYYLSHRNDKIKNIGYDYRKGILKKCLSGVFYLESKRQTILNKFDKLFIFMADHIKSIKKSYNYMLPKNYRDFN